MRKVVVLAFLAAAAAGCGQLAGNKPAERTAVPTASAAPAATGQATENSSQVMAYVNGRPIRMSQLYDLLVRSQGLQTAHQLVADELVRQAAAEKDITVNDQEVNAESDRTLEELFGQIKQTDQRERLLDQLLAQRGISYAQWRMIMRRNAMLRKLVAPQVTVSDEELAEEFGRQYGRKVRVRHIQTASLTAAQEAIQKLKAGADFAELARQISVNPSAANDGLLPMIGADSRMVPPAIREAALAMKQVGEITSPIQVETAFHILKLEEVIEPQNVDFSKVRDELAETVRNRRLRSEQQRLLQELIQSAQDSGTVRYVDPVLKAQAQEAEEQAARQ